MPRDAPDGCCATRICPYLPPADPLRPVLPVRRAQALNILSGWKLSAEPRATALFHYLEASRLAYADRDGYIGDPRYAGVPLHALLSPAFAATAAAWCTIRPWSRGSSRRPRPALKWGNIVGCTNTINFLTSQFGEQFTLATGPVLPLDNCPGDATAIQFLGHGRSEAVAEPVRLGAGSALVVNPSP